VEPIPSVPLTVEVTSSDGKVLLRRQASAAPQSPLVVDVPRSLQAGDRICVQGAQHLAVQLNSSSGEVLTYLPGKRLEWIVPEESVAEPGKAPKSRQPRLSFRPVVLAQLDAYRNIAANPYDLAGADATFPHATADSENGDARNAIDQQRRSDHHQSWDAENGEESWWRVEFGREVEIDKVVIVLRDDIPNDGRAREATLVFSDGHRETISLKQKAEPQTFTFEAWRTSSLRLAELPNWCALTEFEAWGRDQIPVAEDLSALAP
jgi:hypothetical protein